MSPAAAMAGFFQHRHHKTMTVRRQPLCTYEGVGGYVLKELKAARGDYREGRERTTTNLESKTVNRNCGNFVD